MLIAKAITAKITQIVWEHTHKLSCPAKVISAIFTSSIFSVHSLLIYQLNLSALTISIV